MNNVTQTPASSKSQPQQQTPSPYKNEAIRMSDILRSSPAVRTTSTSKVEVVVVDTCVKAIQSTPTTQYYYVENRYTAPPEDRRVGKRRNITLLWVSHVPGFFECQLEDGSRVTIHVNDLKIESKNLSTPAQESTEQTNTNAS